jgi:hypothetical protein
MSRTLIVILIHHHHKPIDSINLLGLQRRHTTHCFVTYLDVQRAIHNFRNWCCHLVKN